MKASSEAGFQRETRCGGPWLVAVAGFSGAALFLALFYPMLKGNIYQASDLGAFHLPARSFYSDCLKSGYRFLWWPDQFCGYYVHGEGQCGMFHPFHWLIYRFMPLDAAFNAEFASGYMFLYAGMLALLRRWNLPWFAALFGANLFTFSGFTLIHFVHMQAIAVIAHLPWLLLATDMLLNATCPATVRRSWVAIALLSASQLLLGYPQYVVFTLMALALYMGAHVRKTSDVKRAISIAVALLVGLLIAGVQVVPTMDILRYAMRQDNAEMWRSGSLHPLNLLQLAGPYWFENRLSFGVPALEYGLYTGTVPLLLALGLATQWKSLSSHRNLVALLVFQGVVMLILSLGEYGGLYGLLAKLPVVGSFRCSARHIVLVHFSLAALAALAVARLHDPHAAHGSDRGARTVALIFVACAWLALGVVFAIRERGAPDVSAAFTRHGGWLLLGPLLVTGGVAVILGARRWPLPGLLVVILFSTADIAVYALPKVWGETPQSTPFLALQAALAEELPRDATLHGEPAEFRAHGNWRVARLTELGLPNYMGYVGLPPAWTLDPDADATKRIAGVRWEKRPLHAQSWTLHDDALPRVRLVTQAVVSDDPREAIATLDVATTAIVERPISLSGGAPGALRWLLDRPGDVAIEAQVERPQLLVFAERYHPGWQVHVDGAPATLERVYGDFMGCVVPAGTHRIGFYFAPQSFRMGVFLSVTGLAALVAGWIALRRYLGVVRLE